MKDIGAIAQSIIDWVGETGAGIELSHQVWPPADTAVDLARELLRLRKALETWRAEWLDSAYEPWTASAHVANETIRRINAILAPDTKETTK